MEVLKKISLKVTLIILLFNVNLWSKPIPSSFADLAEELRAGMGVESALDAIASGRNDRMGLFLREA